MTKCFRVSVFYTTLKQLIIKGTKQNNQSSWIRALNHGENTGIVELFFFVEYLHYMIPTKENDYLIIFQEKKEEIWLSPMTKAPKPTEKSRKQRDNTKTPPKLQI